MNTINIEKLEELINEKWNFNKKKFKLEKSYMVGATVVLHMLNNKENTNGEKEDKAVFWVNEKNYKELEFYGLKVVLNEKPKLTAEDHKFLQKLNPENGINKFYITRDLNGTLVMNFDKPQKNTDYQEWHSDKDHILVLSEELFPFITWESGKAWSKSELMKLKVID